MSGCEGELFECPICLESIGKTNCMTTSCGHTFHASCIIRNLHSSHLCPMCRAPIDEEPKQSLVDLDDDTIEQLIESLTIATRNHQRITGDIINQLDTIIIPNTIENVVDNPINRDSLETNISSIISGFATEVAFDYTYLVRSMTEDNNSTSYPEINNSNGFTLSELESLIAE